MYDTPQLRKLYEATTGNKYSLTIKQDSIPVPRRFYCHWTLPGDEIQYEKGIELVDDPHNRCCFNHRVGLPTRKWESDNELDAVEVIPVPLTHFNKRMIDNYFRHLKYSQNKCRGSGATEILTIRYMIFKYAILNTVPDRKCMILPGTSSKLSDEFSMRIKQICDKIPQVYETIPTSSHPKEFRFKSRGRIILTSATIDAVRGFENVGDILLEEVAHWGLVDDNPVFYATEGVFNKTGCHVVHNTTPRGKSGFYYILIWSPDGKSEFYLHTTNWREVVGLPVTRIEDLYSYGEIDDKLMARLRKECVKRFETDISYKNWYTSFFRDNGTHIPIKELVDVPIPIINVNSIVDAARTDRTHYDQELDNQFVSGENRAIGEFAEVDREPYDLKMEIERFNQARINGKAFNPTDLK